MLYDPKWKITSPVASILIAARKIIENPDDWCGHAPQTREENCAATAVWKTGHNNDAQAAAAYFHLARSMGVKNVKDFNDTHSHAEVLAAFDRAIEVA